MKKSKLKQIIKDILSEKLNVLSPIRDPGPGPGPGPGPTPPPGPDVAPTKDKNTDRGRMGGWIPKDSLCWKVHEVLEYNENGDPENYNSCSCTELQSSETRTELFESIEDTKSVQKLLSESAILRNRIKKYFK